MEIKLEPVWYRNLLPLIGKPIYDIKHDRLVSIYSMLAITKGFTILLMILIIHCWMLLKNDEYWEDM